MKPIATLMKPLRRSTSHAAERAGRDRAQRRLCAYRRRRWSARRWCASCSRRASSKSRRRLDRRDRAHSPHDARSTAILAARAVRSREPARSDDRPIVRYGADVLHAGRRRSSEITPDIQQLVDDMIQTMYAGAGFGWRPPGRRARAHLRLRHLRRPQRDDC
jgi:hypothetical protein